jgi:hypothetical protein
MSFEEDLRAIIRKAQEENAQEDQEGRDFSERWNAMRETTVWRLLKAAEAAITGEHLGAHTSLTNGGIMLEVKWSLQAERFLHKLKFSPKADTREVVCSSSIKDPHDESFTLGALTDEAVQGKVKQFVYECIRDRKKPKSLIA